MDGSTILMILNGVALVVLLILSAVFSGSETALFALSRQTLTRWKESGTRNQKLAASLMEDHHSTLTVILLGTNFVNILASVVVGKFTDTALAGVGMSGGSMSLLLSGAMAAGIVLVFGEVTPKALAIGMTQTLAPKVALPLSLMLRALSPLVRLLKGVSSWVLRLAGQAEDSTAITVDEYQSYIGWGRNLGVFTAAEEQMLQQVFKLRGRSAASTMTPRVDMQSVGAGFSAAEVQAAICEYCHRRLPVVGVDSDDIIGVLNVRRFTLADDAARADWLTNFVMKPVYVPEQAALNRVLAQLRETEQGMVLVVDEYGGVAGLLTAEDILEQVVGDLADEYDTPSYQIAKLSDGHWRVNGSTPVDELQDQFDLDLNESDADTAGGLALELFDNLPERGDTCELEGYTLAVHKMGDKRVLELDIIRRLPLVPADDEEDLL